MTLIDKLNEVKKKTFDKVPNKVKYFLAAIPFISYVALATPSNATKRYVHSGEIIQDVVDISSDGDIIHVLPGEYPESIDWIGKNLEILAVASDSTTLIDPRVNPIVVIKPSQVIGYVFNIQNVSQNSRLTGFVIDGNNPNAATGILLSNNASPIIDKCIVRNVQERGVKFATNSSAQVDSCWITNCGDYGARIDDSNPKIRGNYVWSNGTNSPLFQRGQSPPGADISVDDSNPILEGNTYRPPAAVLQSSANKGGLEKIAFESPAAIVVNPALTHDITVKDETFSPSDMLLVENAMAQYMHLDSLDLDGIWDWHDDTDLAMVHLTYTGYTNPTGVRDRIPSLSHYKVFPNPNSGYNFNLQYELPKAGKVTHSIYDVKGQLVREKDYIHNKGIHTVDLDLEGLPSGTYFIKSLKENKIIGKSKITITR